MRPQSDLDDGLTLTRSWRCAPGGERARKPSQLLLASTNIPAHFNFCQPRTSVRAARDVAPDDMLSSYEYLADSLNVFQPDPRRPLSDTMCNGMSSHSGRQSLHTFLPVSMRQSVIESDCCRAAAASAHSVLVLRIHGSPRLQSNLVFDKYRPVRNSCSLSPLAYVVDCLRVITRIAVHRSKHAYL